MPELPEVQTTVDGLNKEVKNQTITDVWTIYNSAYHAGKDNIKNPTFFAHFKKKVVGAKIIGATRRAKNILIHTSRANKDSRGTKTAGQDNQTILIHMKMTGHIMAGKYIKDLKRSKTDPWRAIDTNPKNPLNDPFNRFLRLVFTLKDRSGKESNLVLSDMRKFAKVTLIPTNNLEHSSELSHLGPEPLEKEFTYKIFETQLEKRKTAPIKQALMDQTLIAGIGNIYSDEILWKAGVHPKSHFSKIPKTERKKMFSATKEILLKGIDFGGDSMSDYRNIYGLRGDFQNQHKAYRRTGKSCELRECKGVIRRLVVGGRSGHFCDVHQKLF